MQDILIPDHLVQLLRRAALSCYQYGAERTEKSATRYLIAWSSEDESVAAVEAARDLWTAESEYLDRLYVLVKILGLLGTGSRQQIAVPVEHVAALATVVDAAESDARNHLGEQAEDMEPELVKGWGDQIADLDRFRRALPALALSLPEVVA
jgi:hypothetical protein